MQTIFSWLDKNQYLGLLLLRLFAGLRLISGVVDNIVSREKMLEFAGFLQTFHFPVPVFSAVLSVYAQAIAGILLIISWKVRFAAILMIINFLTALVMVHRHDTIEQMTPALSLLFISIFLLFSGSNLNHKIGTRKPNIDRISI
jgi:putative oxidoreductase